MKSSLNRLVSSDEIYYSLQDPVYVMDDWLVLAYNEERKASENRKR